MQDDSAKFRFSRRGAIGLGVSAVTTGLIGSATSSAVASPLPGSVDPAAAWRRLEAGNARFVEGRQRHPHEQLAWRRRLADGQAPFACVLGCADSRVTPELVFDHGLGDLFTVRTAGQVLDESIIGSTEYAVEHLGVRLIVVLGHERCGAVTAAIELVRDGAALTGSVSTLVRSIEATVLSTPADTDPAAFLAACVDRQALRVVEQLKERSRVIREAVERHGVDLVAAVYDLDEFRVSRLTPR
ncbi:MAG: carbonic anhydrase [Haloechinothrix sp.]